MKLFLLKKNVNSHMRENINLLIKGLNLPIHVDLSF